MIAGLLRFVGAALMLIGAVISLLSLPLAFWIGYRLIVPVSDVEVPVPIAAAHVSIQV